MARHWLSNLKIVIISRGRWEEATSPALFPFADLVVPDSEYQKYKNKYKNKIVKIPNKYKGLGMVRNWVLDNYNEKIIIMVDDDIIAVYGLMNKNAVVYRDTETIREILESNAIMALDAGCKVFGFNQMWDVRKYSATQPFSFNTWLGGVIGIIGREHRFINLSFKVDADMCLKSLLADRILWCNNMYSFAQGRDKNRGGNSLFKTEERVQQEKAVLTEIWGSHIQFKKNKAGESLSLRVPRRGN